MLDKTIDDRSYCADAEFIFSKTCFLVTRFNNDILPSSTLKKKSADFTVKYLASGCQFFYRYFYGRLPVEHF